MRAPSVAPCRAVPWVPSSRAKRGNGIGETHEEGEVALNSVFEKCRRVRKEGGIAFKELRRTRYTNGIFRNY